jgi:hypothetical protein
VAGAVAARSDSASGRRWSADGTGDRIVAAAHEAGELDWLVAADSSLMRVHQHGATARRGGGKAATVSAGHGLDLSGGSRSLDGRVRRSDTAGFDAARAGFDLSAVPQARTTNP